MCFGCSKEPSHRDGSFEYPQHMFWLRNKKKSVTHFFLKAGQSEVQCFIGVVNAVFVVFLHQLVLQR